jgi:hypothetical protein
VIKNYVCILNSVRITGLEGVTVLFDGEKTYVFWIGLLIPAVAAVGLFGILWMMAMWNGHLLTMLKQAVPVIVAGVVFILIGFYMMKSGAKAEAP